MTFEEITSEYSKVQNLIKTSHFLEARSKLLPLLQQEGLEKDSEIYADMLISLGVTYYYTQLYENALEYYQQALEIFTHFSNEEGISKSKTNLGLVYYRLKELPTAISLLYESLEIHQHSNNDIEKARVLGNIGIIYVELSDYSKSLSYYEEALQIYETHENISGIASNLGSIGNVFNVLGDLVKAEEYFLKALNQFERVQNKFGIAGCLGNLGAVYFQQYELEKAFSFIQQSIEINKEISNKNNLFDNYNNIARIYVEQGDYPSALEYCQKAIAISQEVGNQKNSIKSKIQIASINRQNKQVLLAISLLEECLLYANENSDSFLQTDCYLELYHCYEYRENFEKALYYYKLHKELKDTLYTEDVKNKALLFDQRRKIEEDEKARQLKLARFQEQEKILHNILPVNIADRILNQEVFIADHFNSVSVLFMDLVGFTALSSIAPPKHLVFLLDTIFTKADEIVESFGLEKIKTIGDGYLAVANVTTPLEEHQKATALAALQLLATMKDFSVSIPSDLGETDWMNNVKNIEIRIGIHSGEVVAGIIGKNKYTYDLWGDAVNVASRMESHSEAGRIHVSEKFANGVRHYPEFKLTSRGEITVKGKGTMKTFWLEKAK